MNMFVEMRVFIAEAFSFLFSVAPPLIVLGVAAVLILILTPLRIWGGGFLGFAIRWMIYGGAYYMLFTNPAFEEMYYENPRGYGAAAALVFMVLFLPSWVLAWIGKMILGEEEAAPREDGQAAPTTRIYAEGFNLNEKRTEICVMMTDIVGYSKRMGANEQATWALLKEHNKIMRARISRHNGREIKTIGDAFMVTFARPMDAVQCGLGMQLDLEGLNVGRMTHDKLQIRIGIHMGEATVTSNDVFGDTVNIAARIEHGTPPGGVCISDALYVHVKGNLQAGFRSLGHPPMKNIAAPPEVFHVMPLEGEKKQEVKVQF